MCMFLQQNNRRYLLDNKEHEIKIVMCILVGEEDSWEAESFSSLGCAIQRYLHYGASPFILTR